MNYSDNKFVAWTVFSSLIAVLYFVFRLRRVRAVTSAEINTSARATGLKGGKLLLAGAAAVTVAYVVEMVLQFVSHDWVTDAAGHPLVTDFLEVWVAGLAVLKHTPAAPYDWIAHHAAQVAVVGHPFAGFLGWHYPPLFLFVAGALAFLPYAAAFIAWVCTTAVLYGGVMAKIARRNEAALLALAMPAAFGNVLVGQNGFLSAALIGAALLTLERKPVLSGLFLALLTYKPQFGLVFPLLLFVEESWRPLLSTIGFTIVLLILSWLAFGGAPFAAFFGYLPLTASTILGYGTAGFEKMQSVYGLMRWLGAGEMTAWIAHGVIALLAMGSIIWIWRRNIPYAMKAAAVATATLIVTPYLYMYDFPLLAVPFVFLFRSGDFDKLEISAALAINLVMLVFVWVALPIGPALAAVPALLVARRVTRIFPLADYDVALQRA